MVLQKCFTLGISHVRGIVCPLFWSSFQGCLESEWLWKIQASLLPVVSALVPWGQVSSPRVHPLCVKVSSSCLHTACGNWGSGYRDQNADTLPAAVAVMMNFMSHPREFRPYLCSHDAMQADLLTRKWSGSWAPHVLTPLPPPLHLCCCLTDGTSSYFTDATVHRIFNLNSLMSFK